MSSKYQEIINWLREEYKSGKYDENPRIPTEASIMKLFDVSRHTVRRAVSELISEGILESRQGSGIYFLKNEKTIRISFISYSLDSYIFPKIISGISDELYKNSAELALFHSDYSIGKENQLLEYCLKNEFDGIIFTPLYRKDYTELKTILADYRKNQVPVIFLDSVIPDFENSAVRLNDYDGGRKAAEKFISYGYDRMLVIFGSEHPGMIERKNGFIDKITETGKTEAENIEISLRDSAMKLVEEENRKQIEKSQAIFCCNDQIAAVLYMKYSEILKDKMIIGFDNSHASELLKISSFRHPQEYAGTIAARNILSAIDTKWLQVNQSTVFEAELVER